MDYFMHLTDVLRQVFLTDTFPGSITPHDILVGERPPIVFTSAKSSRISSSDLLFVQLFENC